MAIINDILRTIQPGKAAQADERQALNRSRIDSGEIQQLLAVYKETQDPQVLAQIEQTPLFQKFKGETDSPLRAMEDKSKSVDKLTKLARLKNTGDGVFNEVQNAAIDTKIQTTFADGGFLDASADVATNEQKVNLASFFDNSYTSFKKTSKDSLGSQEETQAFIDANLKQAANLNMSQTAAQALIGDLYAEKTAGRGFLWNDVLPVGSKASDFFSDAPAGKKDAGAAKDPNELEAFENFVQVGTEAFPEDNTPKPRADIGITDLDDQQTMQEVEKAAPKGMDIQQIAQLDPEGFKQMLAALRKGKTPSGKPFTMKDALEMMGNL